MLTLHSVTESTKSILKWGGLAAALILLLIFVIQYIIKSIPRAEEAPNVKFGKLQSIVFPENVSTKTFSYTVNTISGFLPTFPGKIDVYQIIQAQPNLLSLSRAQDRVARIGLTSNPQALSESDYQWDEDIFPFRKFLANIFSFTFSLKSNFLSDPDTIRDNPLPDGNKALGIAQGFFSALESFPEDIDQSKTTTTYFTTENGQFLPTATINTAVAIGINFFQKDVNGYRVFYPHPPNSTIRALVGEGKFGPIVIDADFFKSEYISTPSATYPLKTASEAYEELTKGQGYIASYAGIKDEIEIKNVELGYYQDKKPHAYLMPIIVFLGDDNFLAYVSGVKDEWIEKKQQ